MQSNPGLGEYSKSFITDVPADNNSDIARLYHSSIAKFPLEGVYVYSFKEGKMLFTNGWKEVIGCEDDEVTMLSIVNMTCPDYAPFVHEINDKGLMFIHNKTERLEEYSFTIEIKVMHRDGSEVPVIARVGVHESDEDANVVSIIGRFQVNHNLRFGKVMKYAAYGPGKEEFEEELNRSLFYQYAISRKEKEALSMVAKGFAFKEIAARFSVSQSAIEKRILPLYKRFEVRSLSHLISFAHENGILP